MDIRTAKIEVVRAGRALVEQGLVSRTWGNVSCRIDGEKFAVTPSGIGYERLTPDLIVVVDCNTLDYTGDIKPSSECGIHAAVYRKDPEASFVIHTHQTYATCLSVAGFKTLAPTISQQASLGARIVLAGYGMPGTKKLRRAVMKVYAPDARAVLMRRHGALIAGTGREDAFNRAAMLETICRNAMKEIAEAHEAALGNAALTAKHAGTSSSGTIDVIASEQEDFAVFNSLYKAAFKRWPGLNAVSLLITPAICAQSSACRLIPALLDDFAQIVGPDALVAEANAPAKAIEKRKGRSAVFLKNEGVFCFAEDPSDLEAIQALCEKNALAWQHAGRFGKVKALSLIDRYIMRRWYLTRYSGKR